jgi:hypothetical protein
MVTVYNFKVWDAGCGGWVYPVLKTTADRIKKAKGEIIIGTNEKVDPVTLDAEGRYCPVRAKFGCNKRKSINNSCQSGDQYCESVC